MQPINLAAKLALFDDTWTPKIIAQANGQLVKLAKVSGEFVWHDHAEEDELFLVIKGRLCIRFRDREVTLEPGELCVVPKGVEHCPVADPGTEIMLIEPAATEHTGKHVNERTVDPSEQEWL